ncbi:hypothetical protein QPK87_10380 [Kamptonema cortianum]|nr:hypothetical protein [Geitlerinema splendidum]MDK3156982.1 hypothetical protein [Kamptonema cortianum]
MSFGVQLAADSFQVDPGSSVTVALEISNDGSQREEYELSVEGIDVEWLALPDPTATIDPGEKSVIRLFLKPPRESGSAAGDYPFAVRVRSLETGEAKSAQATLILNSFSHLSVDLAPRKTSVSPFKKASTIEVTVMNLGNTDLSLQLFASDVDDALAYEFSDEQISIAAGQEKVVELTVNSSKVPLFAGASLAAVTISARSTENPAIAASGQAHVEIRPIVAPGPLILVLVAAILVIGWVLSIPKPPRIDAFSLSALEINFGQEVSVQWDTSDAKNVTLTLGDEVKPNLLADGKATFYPSAPGEYEISLVAINGDRRSAPSTLRLKVLEPPVVPDPVIRVFKAEQASVPLGSAATLVYDLSDSVTEAYLEPVGPVDPRARSIQANSPSADRPGATSTSVTYTLIARNIAGKETRKSLTVKFVKTAKSAIIKFEADKAEVDPLTGMVTLTWQVSNAARIELEFGSSKDVLNDASGQRSFQIDKETKFVLIATDSDGMEVRKEITVKVKPPADPGTTGSGDGVSSGTSGSGRPVSSPPTGVDGR